MNPFEYIGQASNAIAHYPLVALLVAAIGGLLSTST